MKRSIVFTDHEIDAFERFFEVLEDSTDIYAYLDQKDINAYRRLRDRIKRAGYKMQLEREAKLRGEL